MFLSTNDDVEVERPAKEREEDRVMREHKRLQGEKEQERRKRQEKQSREDKMLRLEKLLKEEEIYKGRFPKNKLGKSVVVCQTPLGPPRPPVCFFFSEKN